MKKTEETKTIEKQEKVVKPKKEIPQEQVLCNELLRQLRKNLYTLLKAIAKADDKESYVTRMAEAIKKPSKEIAEMLTELDIYNMCKAMNDEERDYLRKLLNNNNNS